MAKSIKIALLYVLFLNPLFSQDEVNSKFIISPIVKSAVLPGWGEYSLDKSTRGNLFLTTEIVGIALTAFSFIKSNDYESTYQGFAEEHADVRVDKKNHQFWVDVGNYNSQFDFNDEHLRFREVDDLYPTEADWNWQWDTEENREEFEDMRIKSDQMKLLGKFFIGGIVLNHIVSVIDVVYLKNISLKESVELSSHINPNNLGLTYRLVFNL